MTRKTVRLATILSLFLITHTVSALWSAEPTWQEQQNLPRWVQQRVGDPSFTSQYVLTTRINPFVLHGDYDGDGVLDVAVLLTHKHTKKEGIGIIHAGSANVIILGAGVNLGNGGDDLSWLDAWSLQGKHRIEQGTGGRKGHSFLGDTILVQKLEAASGLIGWDGKGYRWYQQGD